MNLRELTEDQKAILAQVESGDFTLDQVSDHLEMLEEDRNKKIESYLYVINRLESEANTVHDEIDRLKAILQTKEKALVNIKEWLLISMKDGEKHEFDLFKVTRAKGRQIVTIENDELIPEDYTTFKEVRAIDKNLLLVDLKAGKEVPGAKITISNSSLRIK